MREGEEGAHPAAAGFGGPGERPEPRSWALPRVSLPQC